MKNYFFTSESVSEGHPDKIADQVSDAILDAFLSKDPKARVACETMISTGFVMVAGEVTALSPVDIPELVRNVIRDVGYDHSDAGFDANTCAVFTSLDRQSPDIAMGVDAKDQGAGDQGLMFGYAVNESPDFMPWSIALSHSLLRELARVRKAGEVRFLRPDSKSQFTFEYRDGRPQRIDSIVLSTQHSAEVTQQEIRALVMDRIIPKAVPKEWIDQNTKFHINPTGRFVIGGPLGDCGLTGRKIIVDTYGGHGAHGGGAFSGKDPSKVDRSAAYAARHVAKNIVASGLAERCLVQVAYAIGVAEPLNIMVQDYGTSKVGGEILAQAVREVWDLRPKAIVEQFNLLKPRYRVTSTYGHFGRNEPEFTWEKVDRVEQLIDVVKTLSR